MLYTTEKTPMYLVLWNDISHISDTLLYERPNNVSGHSWCICRSKTGFQTHVSAAGVLLVSCRASAVQSQMRHRLTVDPFIIWVAWIHLVILFSQAWIGCSWYVANMARQDITVTVGIPTAVKRVLWSSWGLGNKIAPFFRSWDFKVACFILLQSILNLWWTWTMHGATPWCHVSSCGEIGSQVHIGCI